MFHSSCYSCCFQLSLTILIQGTCARSRTSLIQEEVTPVSRRLRIALGLAGVAVVLVSLLLLAYTVWPAGQSTVREQVTLAPTVFAPPPTP